MVIDDCEAREIPKRYTVYFKVKDAVKHEWFLQDRFLFKEDKEGYAYFEFLSFDAANEFYYKLKEMSIYAYTNFMIRFKDC